MSVENWVEEVVEDEEQSGMKIKDKRRYYLKGWKEYEECESKSE